MKPPLKMPELKKKGTATIEAKPQIKNTIGDVTRFMPTSLRVKRDVKDNKGRIIKTQTGKDEEQRHKATPQVAGQTKDDAYDLFMREMEDFL